MSTFSNPLLDPNREHHERVLIVDDDAIVLKILRKLVERELCQVETATHVREAKGILAGNSFEVVLCDLRLPDGTGLDLLRHCRESAPRTEFVILTAGADFETVVEAIRLGACNYLEKPILPEKLQTVLKEAIDRRAQPGSLDDSRDRPPKILILDDSYTILKVVSNILTRLGYLPLLAENIPEALALLESEKPDLIISDINLKESSGLDFLSQVKKMVHDVPVIMITSSTSVDTAIEALRRGAYDYLTKPLNPNALELTVKRAYGVVRALRTQERLASENERYRRRLESLSLELDRRVHEAVEEVSQLQRFASHILNSLPTAVVTTDPDLTVTLLNKAAEQFLDVNRGTLEGKPLDASPLLKPFVADLKRAITRRIRINRQVMQHQDLQLGQIEIGYGCSPLVESDTGSVEGGILFFSDLTASHELEGLKGSADSTLAVESTAASIAHELNNLLTITVGMTELLAMDSSLSKKAQGLVRKIDKTIDQISQVLEDKVNKEKGGGRERKTVDLHSSIETIMELVELQLSASNIKPTVKLESQRSAVETWGRELEQVIYNLVKNARDAMSQDGGTLTVRTHDEQDDVIVLVQDSGIGIDPDDIPRLMLPGQTTKPVGKGSGMGLPICQAILKRHGGTLEIKTAPGEGCAVTLRVPRTQELWDSSLDVKPLLQDPARKRVAVVDDESAIRDYCKTLLSKHDVAVTTFKSADDLLAALKETTFDLILSDVMMPGTSGSELLDIIQDEYPSIRICLMTGSQTAISSSRVSMTSMLKKPFRERDLLKMLQVAQK